LTQRGRKIFLSNQAGESDRCVDRITKLTMTVMKTAECGYVITALRSACFPILAGCSVEF